MDDPLPLRASDDAQGMLTAISKVSGPVDVPLEGASGDGSASGAERFCAVTRVRHPRRRLLRFVPDLTGRWTADLMGRLPGRGFYVIPSSVNVRSFLKRRGVVPSEVDAILEYLGKALPARFLDGLGLARRAGCLHRGLREVSEVVRGGERPVLLLAADTAVHTRQKLKQLRQRYALPEVWELLDRERLGLACGNNGPVAVLAVMGSGMSRRVQSDALRLRDFFGA